MAAEAPTHRPMSGPLMQTMRRSTALNPGLSSCDNCGPILGGNPPSVDWAPENPPLSRPRRSKATAVVVRRNWLLTQSLACSSEETNPSINRATVAWRISAQAQSPGTGIRLFVESRSFRWQWGACFFPRRFRPGTYEWQTAQALRSARRRRGRTRRRGAAGPRPCPPFRASSGPAT